MYLSSLPVSIANTKLFCTESPKPLQLELSFPSSEASSLLSTPSHILSPTTLPSITTTMKLIYTVIALVGLAAVATARPTGSPSVWSELRENVSSDS